ncbi:MAG: 30S ribosome-binding factor RbfA [Anaerolineales bacterium]|nr:30S ribosome-binding factor RbfA [Anaerolineales bacterium]
MPSAARALRLGERIRTELAEIFLRESSDPRLRMITVTEVRVDREFAAANVFVSAADFDEARQAGVLQALEGAKGFLRSALAGRIPLRTFPALRFHWDVLPDRAEHIEHLIDSLKKD